MTIKTGFSTKADPTAVAQDLHEQLTDVDPRFLLFFASPVVSPTALAIAMKKAFPGVQAIGCTTAGELTSGHMLTQSVVALAMGADDVEQVAIAEIADPHSLESMDRALEFLANSVGHQVSELDPGRYLGLVLHDGLGFGEEKVMERLGDRTNIQFVGGSAADDLAFETTHVFVDGQARVGSSVLALLAPRRPFHILKTQSFDVLDSVLTATRVSENTRTIHELDDRPAAEAYADAVGVSVADLPSAFRSHPLGVVMADGVPFVRSPQKLEGTDVTFFCNVKEGMQLHLLQARDIVEDTRRDLRAQLEKIGDVRGIINFNCILRTVDLRGKDQCDAYGALFADIPTVGFSTYGESYVGHINQTSTMVLLT